MGFENIHTQPETQIYRYLDETILQQTQNFHKIEISPSKGKPGITAIDVIGNKVSVMISSDLLTEILILYLTK